MTRILIDGNSHLNMGLLRGVDHDEGRKVVDENGKEHQVNGARYGVDNFFEKFATTLKRFGVAPRDVIVVWDGPNSRMRRRNIFPKYKEGRDKVREVSEQLNLARDMVNALLRDIGTTVIQQAGMEADDVIGYLCKTLRDEPNIVDTADGDLCVLIDSNTSVFRQGELSGNPYGAFDPKYITVYKALVGDTSDKIPGATGFGDAAFVDMIRVFGLEALPMVQDMIVDGKIKELRDNISDLKSIQKIVDCEDQVTASWRCAVLHIEDVNTMRKPLEITAGMVKPWASLGDEERLPELRQFYGTNTLVHAGNYDAARRGLKARLAESPFFSLDIETSASEASEEWVAALMKATDADKEKIDVLGHELTGMSITFGQNLQHTIYMTVDHVETPTCKNITVDQCREMVEVLPQGKHIVIQNRSFEFSVLYRTWGDKWLANGWHGFVPNAIDSAAAAHYVDENTPVGLKQRSALHLGYAQTSYETTTTKSGPVGWLSGGAVKKMYAKTISDAVYENVVTDDEGAPFLPGKLLSAAVVEQWEDRTYRMNQLRAAEVADYGCDDTICTAALLTYYKLVMDIEKTWNVFVDVETYPEYLTSLAFVQGIRVSLPKLKELSSADDVAYDAAWVGMEAFLLKKGWEGTVCPAFEGTLEASDVKLAASLLIAGEFTTRKRKLDGIAFDLREQFPDDNKALLLAALVEAGDVAGLNKLVKENFSGKPVLNFSSPKQLQNLFYNVIGVKPRIFNALTEKQRENPAMAGAFRKLKTQQAGRTVEVSVEEKALWISKASTDDDAVRWALAKDELGDEEVAALLAFQTIKTITTARSLFYTPYKSLPHWRDGRLHPAMRQNGTVTRRWSGAAPNPQQLPSESDFRGVFLPHMKDAVVASLDAEAQELKLMAHCSGDVNLTACYVGANKKDMHSLTGSQAAGSLWGEPITYEAFMAMRESDDPAIRAKANALRQAGKVTNFSTNYGGGAKLVGTQLLITDAEAQALIDAKAAAFPGIDIWKAKVEAEAARTGYSLTPLGARRHLREALNADSFTASKAVRQASNFPIQSGSAEQLKLALKSMWAKGIFTGKYRAQLMTLVHDEIVFSVHRDDAVEVIKLVHACMVQPYADMVIPMSSAIAIGKSFSPRDQIEVGKEPDPEAIEKALGEIFGEVTA